MMFPNTSRMCYEWALFTNDARQSFDRCAKYHSIIIVLGNGSLSLVAMMERLDLTLLEKIFWNLWRQLFGGFKILHFKIFPLCLPTISNTQRRPKLNATSSPHMNHIIIIKKIVTKTQNVMNASRSFTQSIQTKAELKRSKTNQQWDRSVMYGRQS